MPSARSRGSSFLAALAFAALPWGSLSAQAADYPAFQPPYIVDREFNFGVGDGDLGTSLIFQWREGWSSYSQFSLEAGFLDPEREGDDVKLLLGGGFARQLHRATDELPLDLQFTAGAYLAAADPVFFQVPVGVVLGHRFPLEGELAITPYLHPRVALQYVSDDDNDESDTDLGVAFDLGVDFEVTRQLSLRAGLVFGDDNRDGVGFSVAWRPAGLQRR